MTCGGAEAVCVDIPCNPPLAVLPDHDFAAATMTLDVGGTLILFTDGLTDAGWRDEPFGAERVAEYAVRHRHSSPIEMARGLMSDVQAHARGALSDDVAIVVLRRMAPAESGAGR